MRSSRRRRHYRKIDLSKIPMDRKGSELILEDTITVPKVIEYLKDLRDKYNQAISALERV